MTATDELRQMLTEAGVEWEDYQHENHTWWLDGNDVCWHAENRLTPSGVLLKIEATLTPEQAIAATVGDTDATQVRQDVAVTVGRGTCHKVLDFDGTAWICSECGEHIGPRRWNFCPNCGRRIEVDE